MSPRNKKNPRKVPWEWQQPPGRGNGGRVTPGPGLQVGPGSAARDGSCPPGIWGDWVSIRSTTTHSAGPLCPPGPVEPPPGHHRPACRAPQTRNLVDPGAWHPALSAHVPSDTLSHLVAQDQQQGGRVAIRRELIGRTASAVRPAGQGEGSQQLYSAPGPPRPPSLRPHGQALPTKLPTPHSIK